MHSMIATNSLVTLDDSVSVSFRDLFLNTHSDNGQDVPAVAHGKLSAMLPKVLPKSQPSIDPLKQ